jgi:hypothetical protein
VPFVYECLGAVAEVELVVPWDFGGVKEMDVTHDFPDFGELGKELSTENEDGEFGSGEERRGSGQRDRASERQDGEGCGGDEDGEDDGDEG